jgi:hypothetical protein
LPSSSFLREARVVRRFCRSASSFRWVSARARSFSERLWRRSLRRSRSSPKAFNVAWSWRTRSASRLEIYLTQRARTARWVKDWARRRGR